MDEQRPVLDYGKIDPSHDDVAEVFSFTTRAVIALVALGILAGSMLVLWLLAR